MASLSQTKDEDKPINWAELPSELKVLIFLRLSVVDILESAQKVCTSWRRVSKDSSLWRKIDMRMRVMINQSLQRLNFNMFCRQAVDRSDGGLVEIKLGDFVSDPTLNYIADRSSNLRSLTLVMRYPFTNDELVNAVLKLPLLEELVLSRSQPDLNLEAIGHFCPKLKILKLNCSGYICPWGKRDDYALAISKSMFELRHLELFGNKLTNIGLNAILDNCPHLQHLDLRKCYNVDFVGGIKKRCIQKIKDLKRPNDSTDDYPFDFTFLENYDDMYNNIYMIML